ILFDDTPPELADFKAILPEITLYGDALEAFEKAKKAKPPLPLLVKIGGDEYVVAEKNKDLFVIASLSDLESGLDLSKVRFWMGAPPGADGKVPDNGKLGKVEEFVPAKRDPKTGE